jgi:hypothetical protein
MEVKKRQFIIFQAGLLHQIKGITSWLFRKKLVDKKWIDIDFAE